MNVKLVSYSQPAARRAARTKKINTASRLIGRLNKYR